MTYIPSEIETDLINRERPTYAFELKMIWSEAKEGRRFVMRALTLKEQSDAYKDAIAYIKKNGIEDPDRQLDIKAAFCIYRAMFREPDKDNPKSRVPVFQDAETVLKTLKPDELTVLGNIYEEVLRMESPFPQGIISNATVEAIVTNLKTVPHEMQELMLKMTREQLTEVVVRLVTDSNRYLTD